MLRPLAGIFALSMIIFIGCAVLRAPLWALLRSGASMPSLGSMVRARWSALLGDSPRLHTAFAIESVNDEMIFVVGPVIVTVLATEVYPAAGVAAAMLLCVTGTLLYGSRTWRTPVERRFLISLCCTAAGISTFWAQRGLLSLVLVIFLSGLTISPTFIAGYSLVEGQAPVHRRTEGMAWLSSSISVGVASESAIVGHIIDASGARWGYAFAAAAGLAAVISCLAGATRPRVPRPADAPA